MSSTPPLPDVTVIQLPLEVNTDYTVNAWAEADLLQQVAVTFPTQGTVYLQGIAPNKIQTPMYVPNTTNGSITYSTGATDPGYLELAFSYTTDQNTTVGPSIVAGYWLPFGPKTAMQIDTFDAGEDPYQNTFTDLVISAKPSTPSLTEEEMKAVKAYSKENGVKVPAGKTHRVKPKTATKA